MKTLICTLILAAVGAASANADVLTIVFDQPGQTGIPGQTLQFFGTITNTSNNTVFLNSDDLNLAGLSLTTTDLFGNTPLSLAPKGQPGDSSGDMELFDVTISSPLLDALGKYLGSYDIVGGKDGGAQDLLATVGFSVTTAPEPSAVILLFTVASAILIAARGKLARGTGVRG